MPIPDIVISSRWNRKKKENKEGNFMRDEYEMEEYLFNFQKKSADGTFLTECYNAFVEKITELAKNGHFFDDDLGDFTGYRPQNFDLLFTDEKILIGSFEWGGEAAFLLEEYGKEANYWFRDSVLFSKDQKDMIERAVSITEKLFYEEQEELEKDE